MLDERLYIRWRSLCGLDCGGKGRARRWKILTDEEKMANKKIYEKLMVDDKK